MAKVIISLVLTLIFAFFCLSSYADTDAPRMQHWLAYYEEYQLLKAQGDIDDNTKIKLLGQLRRLYPEKSALYETKFREEFGDLESLAKAKKEKAEKEKQEKAEAEARQQELEEEKSRLAAEREQLRREQARQQSSSKSASKKAQGNTEKNNR